MSWFLGQKFDYRVFIHLPLLWIKNNINRSIFIIFNKLICDIWITLRDFLSKSLVHHFSKKYSFSFKPWERGDRLWVWQSIWLVPLWDPQCVLFNHVFFFNFFWRHARAKLSIVPRRYLPILPIFLFLCTLVNTWCQVTTFLVCLDEAWRGS